MTGAVPNLASSLAGISGQAAIRAKEVRKRKDEARAREPVRDGFESLVPQTTETDESKELADATSEMATEDRQEHLTAYDADGHNHALDEQKPRIDLEG